MVNPDEWKETKENLDSWLVKYRKKVKVPSLILILLPTIRSRLSTCDSFEEILQHEIFTGSTNSPLYRMNEKTLAIFFM